MSSGSRAQPPGPSATSSTNSSAAPARSPDSIRRRTSANGPSSTSARAAASGLPASSSDQKGGSWTTMPRRRSGRAAASLRVITAPDELPATHAGARSSFSISPARSATSSVKLPCPAAARSRCAPAGRRRPPGNAQPAREHRIPVVARPPGPVHQHERVTHAPRRGVGDPYAVDVDEFKLLPLGVGAAVVAIVTAPSRLMWCCHQPRQDAAVAASVALPIPRGRTRAICPVSGQGSLIGRRWPAPPLAQPHVRAPGAEDSCHPGGLDPLCSGEILAGCNRTHPLVSRSYEGKGSAA